MQLRVLVSSPSSGQNLDLRCTVREGLIAFMQREHPQALPRVRAELQRAVPGLDGKVGSRAASPAPQARLASIGSRPSGDATVSDATGMAGLTEPTGGVPEAAEAEDGSDSIVATSAFAHDPPP